jgi:small subunit ribosomal protein S3
MGQKVNPNGLRIGINKTWDSNWFAPKSKYSTYLNQDLTIRKFLKKELAGKSVSKIEIQNNAGQVNIKIHSAKPGLIIGQQGAKIDELKDKLQREFDANFGVSVVEIPKAGTDATVIAENIASQMERRISYRRVAKMAIEKAMESGAKGAKIRVSGRLNGVDIARSEFFSKGRIPLHTLRADIDYSEATAHTTYGAIGIKVWIYKGEVFGTPAPSTN